ncbi:MAG TPA: ABC transporter permease [Acidimicrobiia bacterium]|nr:ABC transporter permease [Acidimicrobiia bacterium]
MIHIGLTHHLFRQLARGKRLWGMAALSSTAGLVAFIASSRRSAEDAIEGYHFITTSVAAATLSIAILVMGAAVLRDERDGGTLPYLFIKPISRWSFAFSAWVAAAAASAIAVLIGWVVGWVGMGVATGSWTVAVPALSLYLSAVVGYTAIFVPIGYLFTRAVLIGLAYVFVWEGIITSFVTGLSASSVWRTALSIYADLTVLPEGAIDLGSVEPGLGGGLIKLGVIGVAGVSLLYWALRRRDAI